MCCVLSCVILFYLLFSLFFMFVSSLYIIIVIFFDFFYLLSSLFLCFLFFFFFFKQKTAYEMRISDWSSDVCSSDLQCPGIVNQFARLVEFYRMIEPRLPAGVQRLCIALQGLLQGLYMFGGIQYTVGRLFGHARYVMQTVACIRNGVRRILDRLVQSKLAHAFAQHARE